MKVRVAYTVDADRPLRSALCHQWGECGSLAPRQDVAGYFERVGSAELPDVMDEWLDCEECQTQGGVKKGARNE